MTLDLSILESRKTFSMGSKVLKEVVDLDGGPGGGRQGVLGTLASKSETTHGTEIVSHILLVFVLKLLAEVVDETIVEVLATQGVTSDGNDFNNTVLHAQKRHVKRAATQIEDEDFLFHFTFHGFIQVIGDGDGARLVDGTENVKTRNLTDILNGLTLRVVEAEGDGDDGICNRGTKVGLRRFPSS